MYFNHSKGTAWLLLLILLFISSLLNAQEVPDKQVLLTTTPNNCVTLRQGRTCYAKVNMRWQTQVVGNYCLQVKASGQTLQCWRNSKKNQWTFEFQAREKVDYQLVTLEAQTVLAETSVNVSWVHKATPRKRRWRLF
ncbi:DUF3019 domain-containing protein [Thalassotalea sediminis]|uniref:DUF3019 domain-containing protein n=1 Tax=Thalassotalea sediminis TaxID=1759089 RepID=UPI0025740CD1|nr:DUF3019 domain-containing protein [Thalassotalea sediminis]